MVAAFSIKTAAFIFSSARCNRAMVSSDMRLEQLATGSTANASLFTYSASEVATEAKTPLSALEVERHLVRGFGQVPHVGPIHFCFIVHGHKGHANDLWYLHQTVRDKANEHDAFHCVESSEKCPVGVNLAAESKQDAKEDDVSQSPSRRNKRDRLSLAQKIKAKLPTKHTKDVDTTMTGNDKSKTSDIDSTIDESGASSNPATSEENAGATSFIVHNAICNENKTDDGVVNGGDRLADEILQVILYEVEKKKRLLGDIGGSIEPVDVTISLIGNSLGGLYTRYAVARLAEMAKQSASESSVDEDTSIEPAYYVFEYGDTSFRLHFNVFCTTASPHLGCSDHTYFPIPRVAERGIAHGLGETGRDLFRVNNLLHDMATTPRFLGPLSRFRKRIAYANAFGTDFVVPTQTAAFLDEDSHSLHYFDEYFEQDNMKIDIGSTTTGNVSVRKILPCPAKEQGLVVAVFHTKQESREIAIKTCTNMKDLTVMSSSLDSLGWKKVFVDIRREIPLAVSLPVGSNIDPIHNCPIQKLKTANKVVESRDLAKAVSGNPSKAMISLPLGHNAIVAMSRGAVTLAMNGGGMPVVDSLATHLTDDISSWAVA